MAQPPSFSSNNPFRRKGPVPSAPAPPTNIPPFDEADAPSPTPETVSALPSADRFRNQLHALSTSHQPPPATSFQKPKVVKKVRVQSPPPSSPESPRAESRFPPVSLDDEDSSSSEETDEAADPFSYASSTGSADVSDRGDDPQPVPLHRPPPNPFQKTLRELESGAAEPEQNSATAQATTRGALDVGAFGRLLLTGQTGSPGLSQPVASYSPNTRYLPVPGSDGASTADTSSTSRYSISETLHAVQETPRTSGEISAHEADDERRGLVISSQPTLQPAPGIVKKKPPPPSSRHGKLIKPTAEGEANGPGGGAKPPLSSPPARAATISVTSPSRQSPPTPSDVNKPLPAAPRRSPQEQDTESVFDREAAGKVPELELQPGLNIATPPSPQATLHASATFPIAAAQATKKPAPPPRRQPHGRSESRIQSSAASIVQQEETDVSLRRSSIDSTRSRSSSLRANVHAPAPPPPRRPSHPSRGSSSHSMPPPNALPADASFERTTSLSPIVASPPPISDSSRSSTPGTSTPFPPQPPPPTTAPTKLAPPPPPPARNASVRGKKRPVSGAPDAALARKSSITTSGGKGKEQPPPPPRPRNRGNSGASIDAPVPVPMPVPSVPAVVGQSGAAGPPEKAEDLAGLETLASASAAGDILADLSALQREVDALKRVYQQAGTE